MSGNIWWRVFLSLQVERVVTIMQNPRQYKIPDWFLNRQKDVKDGKYSQVGDMHDSTHFCKRCEDREIKG